MRRNGGGGVWEYNNSSCILSMGPSGSKNKVFSNKKIMYTLQYLPLQEYIEKVAVRKAAIFNTTIGNGNTVL